MGQKSTSVVTIAVALPPLFHRLPDTELIHRCLAACNAEQETVSTQLAEEGH